MQIDLKKTKKSYPKVKTVLTLLGAGTLLASSMLFPGTAILVKPFLKRKYDEDLLQWKQFNTSRLKFVLKRMQQQKLVEISETQDGFSVNISNNGKRKLLKYNLEEMTLVNKPWDKKWRIIIYDIDESKKQFRNAFQKILRKLQFYQLQKSVYLTPYPCENEIEFLKQIYDIDNEVALLTMSGLEHEQTYKEYFGLQ